LHQTWHANALKPGIYFRKVKTPNKCPQFDSGLGDSCSSENKHNRITLPRPKLFVSRMSQPRQPVLGSSPSEHGFCSAYNKVVCFDREITGTKATPKMVLILISSENDFCSSETKHDRRMALSRKLFFSARKLQD
jgi:hypothetical protein